MEFHVEQWYNQKRSRVCKKGRNPSSSLFADDMIICTRDAKNFTGKLLQFVNPSSKVSGYKISFKKNHIVGPRKNMETTPFIKNIKILLFLKASII